ncbi:RNA polymerase sigma-70 factor [Pedobacter sp. HMWF019]|uniref:RNA polymerase sigma factor n=1 Tax=Pedobacter sp. HMWF019 TaxID=2056856 RepID=UPI000D375F78|nr:RNA polymerase sigma-70 factor [Pedobacter sp. HMWF019]PTS98789.1 RNA polymerase sigma-70 factor [Pedobacter sp. HMWF019]
MKSSTEHSYLPLLVLISKGDQKAFSALYDLLSPPLIRHILQKIPDETIAEDLIHDLFLSLWKNREKIHEIESLHAYLYSSCRYLIMSHIRKSTRIKYIDDISDYDLQSDDQSLEDRFYYRYLLDTVHKEIENLPEKCRIIFKLSREQQLTNKEISKQLGISESTVENHINKAIKKLKMSVRHYLHFLLFF